MKGRYKDGLESEKLGRMVDGWAGKIASCCVKELNFGLYQRL
jgi:hypothetical protein